MSASDLIAPTHAQEVTGVEEPDLLIGDMADTATANNLGLRIAHRGGQWIVKLVKHEGEGCAVGVGETLGTAWYNARQAGCAQGLIQ